MIRHTTEEKTMPNIYTINTGKVITTSPTGQGRLLQNWFNAHKKGTVKEITDGIRKDLITVQDPMKVVMFYMGYLRKKGIIVLVDETKTIEVPKVEKNKVQELKKT